MSTNIAKLTNTGVNIVGSTTGLTTGYGLTSIGAAGNNFDISSTGSGGGLVTIGTVGASNVAIGNTGTSAIAGTVNLGIAANTVNIGTVGTIAGGGTKVYIGNTGFGYTTQFNTPITLGPAPSSSTQLGYFPSQPTQQNTTTISTNTAVGTISISSAGTYIVFFNCQIKVPTGGPVFANVTGPPNFTTGNNGFSGLYSSASPYYQSMTGSFFVTTTGSYSYSIVININPSQVSLVTQAYLDYNYIRIA